MKGFITFLVIIVMLIIILGIMASIVGLFIPGTHHISVSVILNANRIKVWKVITNYKDMPNWWPNVKSIEKQMKNGKEIWINTDKHGKKIVFYTSEEKPAKKLIRTIDSTGKLFGGSWTYELISVNNKTRLTITEDGFISQPYVRLMAKLFMKKDATIQDFIFYLKKKLKS